MLYALISPKGKIIDQTIGFSREEAEGQAFNYMAMRLGRNWMDEFWKRWQPAQEDIRSRGYKIKRVRLVAY